MILPARNNAPGPLVILFPDENEIMENMNKHEKNVSFYRLNILLFHPQCIKNVSNYGKSLILEYMFFETSMG